MVRRVFLQPSRTLSVQSRITPNKRNCWCEDGLIFLSNNYLEKRSQTLVGENMKSSLFVFSGTASSCILSIPIQKCWRNASLHRPFSFVWTSSSLFSYVSATLRNALPDFIRTYEFTGFKRESSWATFCTAAFLFNEYISKYFVFSRRYLYMLCICNVSKILAPVGIREFEMK